MRAPFKIGRKILVCAGSRRHRVIGRRPTAASAHTHCLGHLVKELRNFRCAESDYSTDFDETVNRQERKYTLFGRKHLIALKITAAYQ